MSLIEKIARDIADALGDNFDYAFNSKPEWTAARGETKAGFRDVNQPYKPDYLDAAQAALTAIMDAGDGVQQCDREAAAVLVYENTRGNLNWMYAKRNRDLILAGEWDNHHAVQAFARHRSTAAAAERARIVAAVERELAMTAMANAEEASTDWIDGFEHAWKRAKAAIERGEV